MKSGLDQKYKRILGVKFFIGTPEEACAIGSSGGLVVVPAAPALVEIEKDKFYRQALLDADLVITDSGLLVLLWRIIFREKILRFSGLEYLRMLLQIDEIQKPSNVVWIMPTKISMERNISWLNQQGIHHTLENCYLAPFYPAGDVHDPLLLGWIEARNPRHIIVALGGGTQERLGRSLQMQVKNRPGIHCIGAAIGFLSGDQVRIPMWADYFYLGWLFRCISSPIRYVPRYWKALRLVRMVIQYGEKLPPLKGK
jgi:N-acetylglucosaminyldiphosphoundecaprenol N-acetyl-beta-D-mannosaminyltransferase